MWRQTPLSGVIELDEYYFGPKPIPGVRGRGAGSKTIVFGIFKRNDNVNTEIVPDTSKASLVKVIRGHVSIESVLSADGWRGYNGLVYVGYSKHFRVRYGDNAFANGSRHLNGIESFWSYVKRRLVKFIDVSRKTFFLHLKEAEFRFNHLSKDLYRLLLRMLSNDPL